MYYAFFCLLFHGVMLHLYPFHGNTHQACLFHACHCFTRMCRARDMSGLPLFYEDMIIMTSVSSCFTGTLTSVCFTSVWLRLFCFVLFCEVSPCASLLREEVSLLLPYHGDQFGSVQSLYRFGRRWDMRDDSAEIIFRSLLQEARVSSSGIGRDVCFLMLFIQHSLCRPRRRPPPRCPEGWSWRGCRGVWRAPTMFLGSCQKRFLWTHKGVDLAPHPVVGLRVAHRSMLG